MTFDTGLGRGCGEAEDSREVRGEQVAVSERENSKEDGGGR
jgi:hypothetical protein